MTTPKLDEDDAVNRCNRCDQDNRNEQDEVDEPDFTLDDLEWSEEHE
jgi:hypothetical protein